MQYDFASLSSDELIKLYHKANSELSKNLLSGSPLNEQQERITTLTQISKELTQRKIDLKRLYEEKQAIKNDTLKAKH